MDFKLRSNASRRVAGIFVLLAVVGATIWLVPLVDLLTALFTALLGVGMFPPVLMAFPGVWWRRGTRPPCAVDHVTARVPVWSALSELYLDTELDERDHARIADVLARSGYGLHQLDEILYREVHPVVFVNLLSGFGEWAGFDSEWLAEKILARNPPHCGVALVPAKWVTQAEWQLIRERVATILEESGP